MNYPLYFDIYAVKHRADKTPYITIMFAGVSLNAAELISGADRDGFRDGIMGKGWVGTSPAWTGFSPLVVMPHGNLIRNDQFKYVIESAG